MSVSIEEVKKIVATQLGKSKVEKESRLIEDLEAESMDLVNIIAAVEARFDVFIEEEEIPKIRTIADLFYQIQKQLTVS
jgi:acyl carrier protein